MGIFDWFRGRRASEAFDFDEAVAVDALTPARIDHGLRDFPGFQESANMRPARGAKAAARQRMRAAFSPANPISDVTMFAGRREVLVQMIRAIEDRRFHLVLYGDRGIGKTSMLHVLSYLARQAGYLVRYTSCSEGADFSQTFRTIARDIPIIYHNAIEPTSELVERGATLADLLPDGDLTATQISELFANVTGTRVLIVLDEFDRSDSVEFRRWTAELIKNLSDRSTRVQPVIAGVAGNLNELIEHIPSIRRNIFCLPVPSMTDKEIEDIIEIGAQTSGVGYQPSARAQIVGLANGSPYLANLIGQHAGLAALDRGAESVSAADVQVALERALYEIEQRVPPKALYQLKHMSDPELRAALESAAKEALTSIGRIEAPAPGDTRRAAELDRLASEFRLIEDTPEAPGAAYRFIEDGVALYLWLTSAARDLKKR